MPTEREKFLARLQELYSENVEISRKKNSDYTSAADPFQNFRVSSMYGIPVDKAILVRMSDKLQRISVLLNKEPDVVEESIKDTCSDLANYAMILRMWVERQEG